MLLVAAAGCAKTDPADDIGRFAVTQTQTEGCGSDTLLAAPQTRHVVVYLRRVSAGVLHWRQGDELLILTYNPQDGSFTSRGSRAVDMRAEGSDKPSCIIERDDVLHGELITETVDAPAAIKGEFRYQFVPSANSSCDDLLTGPTPLATEMPCALVYEFVGEAQ